MSKKLLNLSFICLLLILSMGCNGESEIPLFKKLSTDQTGISFNNLIEPNDTLNIQGYPFLYNGAGVGVGDINNDGLQDIFFAGNKVTSRLYLNKGNLQFKDITKSAGVETSVRASGVSMVDINADGYLDIYVSVGPFGNSTLAEQANLLFINNGDNTFTESAAEYNVQGRGYTTHSAFLDYDRDGDLDLYLVNNSPVNFARNEMARKPSILIDQTASSFDELYRNDGNKTFTRVSKEAGILRKTGFGLGVTVADFNMDGWPDLYISNDILPDDVLYINNRDGTFSDKTKDFLKHISFAGMGVDAADFNNDGWPDILQADMMPENDIQRKRISGANNYEHASEMHGKGYHYQYNLNTLQLSNGIDDNDNLAFSEIARLSGVAYTNWSWSALFGDYDNDGLKDIMITNGYPKAVNDFDYIQGLNSAREFGSRDIIKEKELKILEELYAYNTPNYIFKNNGDLTFEDKTQEWSFDDPGFSYGASQADLDNDGDLDFVINNINGPALIYQNQADTVSSNHHLAIKFKGPKENPGGVGANVKIKQQGKIQYQYFSPYRGFASTMGEGLLFGLGGNDHVDSLRVVWPDGRSQLITDLDADQQLILNYDEATETEIALQPEKKDQLFVNVTKDSGISHQHKENEFNDYSTQPLLSHQLSKLGPALTTGDVNGDGLEDIYVGGAAGQEGAIYLQKEDGSFERSNGSESFSADAQYEDIGATLFDADGDGDLDLYVTSGGNEFSPASLMLQDRFYLNTGSGEFIRNRSALPRMLTSSSVVQPCDYDRDGDLDLFVGGRLVPGQYPKPAKSYILRNDGASFTNVTASVAPDLVEPGLITDAVWSDFNSDGQPDLITTGIWQPVTFFKNNNGNFVDVTEEKGLSNQRGWWYSIETGDFDNDGDPDFVAGNMGLNYSFPADNEESFEVYAGNFDSNQSYDLMFSIERDGDHYPYYGRAKFEQGIPEIKYLFKTYKEYAEAEVVDVIGRGGMNNAVYRQVDNFASVYIENKGDEPFEVQELPVEAQFSAIQDIIAADINKDHKLDLIIGGNLFESEPEIPRNDASNGLVMLGDGNGGFNVRLPFSSGLLIPRNVKNMKMINRDDQLLIIVANNDGPVQLFKSNTDSLYGNQLAN